MFCPGRTIIIHDNKTARVLSAASICNSISDDDLSWKPSKVTSLFTIGGTRELFYVDGLITVYKGTYRVVSSGEYGINEFRQLDKKVSTKIGD